LVKKFLNRVVFQELPQHQFGVISASAISAAGSAPIH
jgi:hypothetical protein